jgi:hypothetical protein
MAHPYHHALSSVKKWGGVPEDYEPIHAWFDESKSHFADFRHRAMRHHSEGIFMAEHFFGKTITNSDGRVVPVRFVGEQHVTEDCGWIPTVADWLKNIQAEPWMKRVGKKLAHTLEIEKDDEPRTITENAVRQSQEVEVG